VDVEPVKITPTWRNFKAGKEVVAKRLDKWRLTQGNSLWVRIMNSKYIPNMSIVEWFRISSKSSKGSIVWKILVQAFSMVGGWSVWKILVQAFSMVGGWSVWKVENVKSIRLAEGPWVGFGQNYILSGPMLQKLMDQNIFSLNEARAVDP
jgi:hypothetical protein